VQRVGRRHRPGTFSPVVSVLSERGQRSRPSRPYALGDCAQNSAGARHVPQRRLDGQPARSAGAAARQSGLKSSRAHSSPGGHNVIERFEPLGDSRERRLWLRHALSRRPAASTSVCMPTAWYRQGDVPEAVPTGSSGRGLTARWMYGRTPLGCSKSSATMPRHSRTSRAACGRGRRLSVPQVSERLYRRTASCQRDRRLLRCARPPYRESTRCRPPALRVSVERQRWPLPPPAMAVRANRCRA
jgi:hypothetical protein